MRQSGGEPPSYARSAFEQEPFLAQSPLRTCTHDDTVTPMAAARSGGRRGARATRGAISRDQIVEAALRLLAEGSHDQLTIRALAEELVVRF